MLSGLWLSFTSISQQERDELMALVVKHGGQCLGDFEAGRTTHLVARKVGTSKYKAAVREGIPVVSADFVFACVREGKVVDTKKFLLGPFSGLTITISGVQGKERADLIAEIKRGDGVYEGDLHRDLVTHLVVREAGISNKYHHAVLWKVKIVTPDWIRACVDLGAWKDEEEFAVRVETPEMSIVRIEPPAATNVVALPIRTEVIKRPEIEKETATDFNTDSGASDLEASLTDINLSFPMLAGMLSSCIMYIDEGVGSDVVRRKLRVMATAMDAIVAWEPLPQVTHIIVAPWALDNVASIRKSCPSALPVRCDWIVQCYNAGRRFPVREFMCAVPDDASVLGNTTAVVGASNKRVKSTMPPKMSSLEGLEVCVSMYIGGDRKEVERLAKYLGATFTEKLTNERPGSTVLVVNGTKGEKYAAAVEWKIQYIADLEWLRQCALAKAETEGTVKIHL